MKTTLKKMISFTVTALTVFGASFGMMGNTAPVEEGEKRYYDVVLPATCASAGDYEIITFARKEETYIETPNTVPYYFSPTLDNACGPVGGTIIVGYYDKYFENLIPDYTNYYPATGKYRPQNGDYICPVIEELYDLMQTNVVAPGVSEEECLDGLQAYVEGQGYSISYSTAKTLNGSFNHTAYQNAINNQQPVLLFCESVELYELFPNETQDRNIISQVSNNHIMVGFGYKTIKYYDENDNNFRTDTYLRVASGWDVNNRGYVKINSDSWLDTAYAVDIY